MLAMAACGSDAVAPDGSPVTPDPAVLAASPATLDFGSVTTGSPMAVASVTVRNVGKTASGTVMASVMGAQTAQFHVFGTTCTTLEPDATCTVTVEFEPMVRGAAAAELIVTASPGGSVGVTLAAVALIGGGLTMSPVLHDFGSVATGTLSTSTTFTLSNAGGLSTSPLTVTIGGTDPGAYQITSQSCSGSALAPGASCTIAVQFAPATNGTLVSALTVSGAPGGTVTAALSAVGQQPANLVVTPSSSDHGSVVVGTTSAATTFTVTNTGGVASGILGVTLGGATPNDFAIGASSCTGILLAAGGTCTVSVTFTPSSVIARSATLSIAGTPGGTAVATLAGNGIPSAGLYVSPTMSDFGGWLVGATSTPQTFTVVNSGGAASGVIAVSLAGAASADFALTGDTCTGTALAAAGTCVVTATFMPSIAGSRTASIAITGMPGGTVTAAVSGTGL